MNLRVFSPFIFILLFCFINLDKLWTNFYNFLLFLLGWRTWLSQLSPSIWFYEKNLKRLWSSFRERRDRFAWTFHYWPTGKTNVFFFFLFKNKNIFKITLHFHLFHNLYYLYSFSINWLDILGFLAQDLSLKKKNEKFSFF